MKVGIRVYCEVCKQQKQPHGRSAPIALYLCNADCDGYEADPQVGDLWLGESEIEFGYPVREAGTVSAAEFAEAGASEHAHLAPPSPCGGMSRK